MSNAFRVVFFRHGNQKNLVKFAYKVDSKYQKFALLSTLLCAQYVFSHLHEHVGQCYLFVMDVLDGIEWHDTGTGKKIAFLMSASAISWTVEVF